MTGGSARGAWRAHFARGGCFARFLLRLARVLLPITGDRLENTQSHTESFVGANRLLGVSGFAVDLPVAGDRAAAADKPLYVQSAAALSLLPVA